MPENTNPDSIKLFNDFPIPSVLLDSGLRVKKINNEFTKIFGYREKEIENELIDELIVPKDKGKEAQQLNKNIEQEYFNYETIRSTKSNKELPVLISVRKTKINNKKHYIVTYNDISERKEIREREDFLHSILRHNLKNKIQVIRGYLELLKETKLNENQKEMLDKSIDSTINQIDLIEKVRTLDRIRKELSKKNINVNSLIERAIEENEEQAEEKNFKIKFNFSEQHKVLGGELLKKVFSNIIENSIKHSKGNCLKISIKENKDKVNIIFEDNGIGLEEDWMDKIYQKGLTVNDSQGAGIGAFLIKRITESYGGEVKADNSESGGARFEITLNKSN